MKKQTYMKPTMCVVEINHRCQLLSGSPEGYNGQNVKMFGGSSEKQINDEDDVY